MKTNYTREFQGLIEGRFSWLYGESKREITIKDIDKRLQHIFRENTDQSVSDPINDLILTELLDLSQHKNSFKGFSNPTPKRQLSKEMFNDLVAIALEKKRYDLVTFLYNQNTYFHSSWRRPENLIKNIEYAIHHAPVSIEDHKQYKNMLLSMTNLFSVDRLFEKYQFGSRNVSVFGILQQFNDNVKLDSSHEPIRQVLSCILERRTQVLSRIRMELIGYCNQFDYQSFQASRIVDDIHDNKIPEFTLPIMTKFDRLLFSQFLSQAKSIETTPEELHPFYNKYFRSVILEAVFKKIETLQLELGSVSNYSFQAAKNRITGLLYNKAVIKRKLTELLVLTKELNANLSVENLKKTLDKMIETAGLGSGRLVSMAMPSKLHRKLRTLRQEITEKLPNNTPVIIAKAKESAEIRSTDAGNKTEVMHAQKVKPTGTNSTSKAIYPSVVLQDRLTEDFVLEDYRTADLLREIENLPFSRELDNLVGFSSDCQQRSGLSESKKNIVSYERKITELIALGKVLIEDPCKENIKKHIDKMMEASRLGLVNRYELRQVLTTVRRIITTQLPDSAFDLDNSKLTSKRSRHVNQTNDTSVIIAKVKESAEITSTDAENKTEVMHAQKVKPTGTNSTSKAIYPAIVWQDRLTADFCRELENLPGFSSECQQRSGLLEENKNKVSYERKNTELYALGKVLIGAPCKENAKKFFDKMMEMATLILVDRYELHQDLITFRRKITTQLPDSALDLDNSKLTSKSSRHVNQTTNTPVIIAKVEETAEIMSTDAENKTEVIYAEEVKTAATISTPAENNNEVIYAEEVKSTDTTITHAEAKIGVIYAEVVQDAGVINDNLTTSIVSKKNDKTIVQGVNPPMKILTPSPDSTRSDAESCLAIKWPVAPKTPPRGVFFQTPIPNDEDDDNENEKLLEYA